MPYKQYPDFFNKHPLPKEFDYSAFRVSCALQRQNYEKYRGYLGPSDPFMSWIKRKIAEIIFVLKNLKLNLESMIEQSTRQHIEKMQMVSPNIYENIYQFLIHIPAYLAMNRSKLHNDEMIVQIGLDELQDLRIRAYADWGDRAYDRLYEDIHTVLEGATNYVRACEELREFILTQVSVCMQNTSAQHYRFAIQEAVSALTIEANWWQQAVCTPLESIIHDRYYLALRNNMKPIISGTQYVLSMILAIIVMFTVVCVTLLKMFVAVIGRDNKMMALK